MWCFPSLPFPLRSLQHFLPDDQNDFSSRSPETQKTPNAELRFFSSSSSFSFCFLASCFCNDRTLNPSYIQCRIQAHWNLEDWPSSNSSCFMRLLVTCLAHFGTFMYISSWWNVTVWTMKRNMIPVVTSKPQVCVPHSYPLLKNSVIVPLVSKLPSQTNHLPATHLAKVSASHLSKVHIIGFMQRSHKNLPKILPPKMGNDTTVVLFLWIFFIFLFAISFALLFLNVCQALLATLLHAGELCEKSYVGSQEFKIWPKIPRRIRESPTSHTNQRPNDWIKTKDPSSLVALETFLDLHLCQDATLMPSFCTLRWCPKPLPASFHRRVTSVTCVGGCWGTWQIS